MKALTFATSYLMTIQSRTSNTQIGRTMQMSNFSSSSLKPLFVSLIPIILLVFTLKVANSQSLPPAKYDGFVYQHYEGHDSNSILIEAFYDPVCPDSRDSWPPLKQALHFYGPRVWLLLHILPLPYHDNAYATSRVLHIVNSLNNTYSFPLLEKFFKYQEKFYNNQTKKLSRVSVVKKIVKFAAGAVGNSHYPKIEAGFQDRQTDLKTRVSFKHSTSRGVYATPTFFVNGFLLPDAGSARDYDGWRKIIDPLIRQR